MSEQDAVINDLQVSLLEATERGNRWHEMSKNLLSALQSHMEEECPDCSALVDDFWKLSYGE